jgi:uncharacterized protein YceH (UPF0502 family)
MSVQLNHIEARVLGSLIEKERATPDYYPMTLNSLVAACNQSTNRDPIVAYDEATVGSALDQLREKKLASLVHTAGARVPKHRHRLLESYDLDDRQVALLCVLLLRGPQTAGELRSRIERLCGVSEIMQVETALNEMCAAHEPLVRVLPARAGQKEKRFVHLLCGEPDIAESAPVRGLIHRPPPTDELAELKSEVARLQTELDALREEFRQFRQSLE